jgi:hypothetical protein
MTEEITPTETLTPTEEITPTETPTPPITVTIPLTEIIPLPGPILVTPGEPPVAGILVDPPGSPSDEFVVIANGATPQDLSGWTLENLDGVVYTFDAYSMAPDGYVRLWTGEGVDRGAELYWGRDGEDLWQAEGGSATLRDAEGNIVSICTYTAAELIEGLRVCPVPIAPGGTIP